MLNYISAEWYKLCRTKGIFLAFVFLLFMIGLIFYPWFFPGSDFCDPGF